MLPFFRFWWDCFLEAWHHAWTTAGVIATVLALLIPFVIWIKPKWLTPMRQGVMTELIWQIPVTALFALFAVCFVLAPYWIYQQSQHPKTFLGTSSVQMVFPGNGEPPQPVPNTNVNVYRYTALRYNALMQEEGSSNPPIVAGVKWGIYIIFDNPISTEVNFFSTTNVHPKPDIELRDVSPRGAIVIIGAEMPAGLVELQFRTAQRPTRPSPIPDTEASPH